MGDSELEKEKRHNSELDGSLESITHWLSDLKMAKAEPEEAQYDDLEEWHGLAVAVTGLSDDPDDAEGNSFEGSCQPVDVDLERVKRQRMIFNAPHPPLLQPVEKVIGLMREKLIQSWRGRHLKFGSEDGCDLIVQSLGCIEPAVIIRTFAFTLKDVCTSGV